MALRWNVSIRQPLRCTAAATSRTNRIHWQLLHLEFLCCQEFAVIPRGAPANHANPLAATVRADVVRSVKVGYCTRSTGIEFRLSPGPHFLDRNTGVPYRQHSTFATDIPNRIFHRHHETQITRDKDRWGGLCIPNNAVPNRMLEEVAARPLPHGRRL